MYMYVFIYIFIYRCKYISIYISMVIYVSITSKRMTLNVNIIYKYTHVYLNMSYWMQISSVTFGLGHWSWGGENRDNFVTCALQSCTVQNRAFEFACVCTHNPYRIPAAVAHNSTQALVSYTHTSASKHALKHMHSTCPTHTYTHTHVHARTRMRARTHTHIHLYAEHFDHTDGYKSSTCTPLLRSMAWATCHRLLFSLLHTNTYVYTTYFIIVHNKHICTHTHTHARTRTLTHTHT